MASVGGSGELQGEKTSNIFFDPNELKSPKNNMSFFVFFPHLGGGWVGQKQVWNFTHFFFFFFEPFPYTLYNKNNLIFEYTIY